MQGGSKNPKIDDKAKLVVQRHGGGGGAIRSYNAAEKAAETKVRQHGKKEIKRQLRGEDKILSVSECIGLLKLAI